MRHLPWHGFYLLVFQVSAVAEAAPVPRGGGPRPDDSRLGSDQRLGELSHLPFVPGKTAAKWKERATFLRRQVKVGLGLWPLPTRTPLNAVIHGRVKREDYTVEKVYFESLPGHFVTGNLYRPAARTEELGPAVLCAYGHWDEGRFNRTDDKSFAEQLQKGFERFDPSGRYPLQARCVHLARMGCVVFIYDMIGYSDSIQLAHRPPGFESAEAHLHLINAAGLQTWNSIRAFDFVSALDGVDRERVAVTGASGGGMQSQLLCAVDDRPAVSVPVVSVFVSRKGAPCTYGPYMRTEEGTIGTAALAAPRPLCVINAGLDWTGEFMTHGYPQLKEHYRVLGIEDRFAGMVGKNHPHNYNAVSREYMYGFLKKHLKLDEQAPVVEREFKPLTKDEMKVWDTAHAKPSGMCVGGPHERAVRDWFVGDARKQLDALVPSDPAAVGRYREVAEQALEVMIGRALPRAATLRFKVTSETQWAGVKRSAGLLSNVEAGTKLPLVLLEGAEAGGQAVLWVQPEGKGSLFEGERVRLGVRRLLEKGFSVVGVDLLYQGDFLEVGKPVKNRPLIPGTSIQYTLGNRRPLFSERVFDLLCVVRYLRSRSPKPSKVHVLGLNGGGHWVAAACALAKDEIDSIAIDTKGFRFARLNDVRHADFLPGAAKYHDLPGMLALCAPHKMWLAGEKSVPDPVGRTYAAAGVAGQPALFEGEQSTVPDAAVEWIIGGEAR